MTYFWETVDTIAPGLGWPHFGPFISPCSPFFLLLGAVLCRGYCGMDTDKATPLAAPSRCCSSRTSSSRTSAFFTAAISASITCRCTCAPSIFFLIALHAWRRPKLLDTFFVFRLPARRLRGPALPDVGPLPPLNFMVIHSFTVHFLLALYPLALTLCGDMDPQPRAFPRCFALLAAMAVPIWFFRPCVRHKLHVPHARRRGQPAQALRALRQPSARLPVLLAVVFAVMYLLLRVLRRRTAVPAGK